MSGFTILKELGETPATLNGKYTRVYVPKGTLCQGDGKPRTNTTAENDENGFNPVTSYGGKYYRVSCNIGDAKYENIDLYESEKGFGWQKTVGGRRKNNRTAKKQRKNRSSSRHRARRLR